MPAKKEFKNITIRASILDELEKLRTEIESTTGLQISRPALMERAALDGIDSIRRRPLLAIDCSPKADDRAPRTKGRAR